MVQGFEQASLTANSRPYKDIPSSSFPMRTQFNPAQIPSSGLNKSMNPGPISPTVQASVFQAQQAKRASVLAHHQNAPSGQNKENQASAARQPLVLSRSVPGSAATRYENTPPRQTQQNQPSYAPQQSSTRHQSPARIQPETGSTQDSRPISNQRAQENSARQQNQRNTFYGSDVSVETMATRSSDSTHANSLLSATTRYEQDTGFVSIAQRILINPPAPEIVKIEPTPVRKLQPTALHTAATPTRAYTRPYDPRHESVQQTSTARPVAHSRAMSTFSEESSSSCSLNKNAETELDTRYSALPLDAPPPPIAKDGVPRQRRARASTVTERTSKPSETETRREKEARIAEAFARLLDTMQIPDPTVREKMMGLALPLKEEMLKNASTSSNKLSLPTATRANHSRGRSLNLDASVSANSAHSSANLSNLSSKKENLKSAFVRKAKSNGSLRPGETSQSRPGHARTTSATSAILRSLGRSTGASTAKEISSASASPEFEDSAWWAVRIRSSRFQQLSVTELGKLRGRLRTESVDWVTEFIKLGGFLGILTRLKEIFSLEWREEQRDDLILFQLLKTLKALTMTRVGKTALGSRCPTPFVPFASLLFSEKRPGDLPCRQLLVELIHSVFEINPVNAQFISRDAYNELCTISLESPPSDANDSGGRRYLRKMKSDSPESEPEEIIDKTRREQTHNFVYSLMLGPPDEKEESKIEFIRETHRPRKFKVWVKEFQDTMRDFFWVFCHSDNLFWSLDQIDPERISSPKVPSGMTAGVEFEAMSYVTSHLRLLNSLVQTCPSSKDAWQLHFDLFESGFERVLLHLRRASLVYYPFLHLELARYIASARAVRFNLGPRLLSCLDARILTQEETQILMQQRITTSKTGAPQLGQIQV